ncbi:MAG: tetratricopeptide repeat protein [Desulfobulbaceae bacterium]|nr:tetratricopeptide repeat protein [Desulfobulbaceae bacterium]
MKLLSRTFLLLILFIFNTSTLMAVAFPFREFDVGDQVPEVELKDFKDAGRKVSFSDLRGRPFVAVFWGADIEEKMNHSALTLQGIETLSSFLQARQIRVLSVNVMGDHASVIEQVTGQAGSNVDVYVDQDGKAYASLGLFVMPTVLLVDKDGKAAAGLGYSRDIVDRLRGEIEIMLNEKSREQVMAELRPEMKELSEKEKAGSRHMNFALVMRKRGQPEIAVRELKKAIEANPELAEAYVELGCIYLEKGELDEAEKAFDNALENGGNSLRARVCKARLLREKGLAAEAVRELLVILQEHPDAYDALYTLGLSYEDLDKMQEAMASYRKAYRSIQVFVAGKD